MVIAIFDVVTDQEDVVTAFKDVVTPCKDVVTDHCFTMAVLQLHSQLIRRGGGWVNLKFKIYHSIRFHTDFPIEKLFFTPEIKSIKEQNVLHSADTPPPIS